MSNKKDFFKLWNKYLKNQKLNESSQEAIDANVSALDLQAKTLQNQFDKTPKFRQSGQGDQARGFFKPRISRIARMKKIFWKSNL